MINRLNYLLAIFDSIIFIITVIVVLLGISIKVLL